MAAPFLRKLNPLLKLAYFFSLFLISLGVALILSILVIMGVEGGSFEEVQAAFEAGELSDNVLTMELLNFVTQVTNFLAPALLFVLIFGRISVNSLWFKKPPAVVLLIPLLLIASNPFVEWSALLNDWLIPEGGWIESWALPMEQDAADSIEKTMEMPTASVLWRNIFFVAIVPAFCEEIAFRGVIQSLVAKASRNVHVGIWAAAIMFSLIHFQFYGFIPRVLLGAFFGYLLIWTGSIWAPIIAHFANNAIAVCVQYFYQHSGDEAANEFVRNSSFEWVPAIISVILFIGIVYLMIRKSLWKKIKPAYLWYDSSPRRPIHPMEN